MSETKLISIRVPTQILAEAEDLQPKVGKEMPYKVTKISTSDVLRVAMMIGLKSLKTKR